MSGEITYWLAEVSVHDGSSETVLYFSDHGYTTRPDDTPANQYFDPRIIDPGSLRRSIFSSGTTYGDVSVGYGRLVLNNGDGGLAALRSYGFGRYVKIWSLTTNKNPNKVSFSNAVLQFQGIVSHPEGDNFDELSLVFRDELGRLNRPLQESQFDGTSTGPTGIEGNSNVAGRIKPMAFGGFLRNIQPELVNNSKEARAWNFDRTGAVRPSANLDALRNGGAPYDLSGTDHADLATLFAATVPGSEADSCLAESLLRTSGSVTALLTADVTIAPEVTNLLTYSEQFDNAAWTKTNVSATANAATAPDGNVTADKLVEDSTASSAHKAAEAGTITAGAAVVGNCYLQAAERTRARLTLTGASGSLYVDANLGAGTLGTATATGSYSGASAEIEAVGDAYRVTVKGTTATDTTLTMEIALADAGGSVSYDGDGTSGLYAWGAMLIAGTAAKPYIKTESSTVTLRCEATAARVAAAILAEHGYSIEPDSLLALDAKNNALVGVYFNREITILDAVQRVLESIGGYLIATRTGTFRVGRFEAPAGPVRKAITEDTIEDGEAALSLLPTDSDGTGIPVYTLSLAHSVNWTPQNADALTGSVSQDDRSKWAAEHLLSTPTPVAIRTKHPEAREELIRTVLTESAAADAEAVRRLAFLSTELSRFRVPLATDDAVWDSDPSRPIDIGDRVTLTTARYGFSTATDFVVIGVDQQFAADRTILDVVNSSAW